MSDSSRPTSAIASAYGATMDSVCVVKGTSGKNSVGRLDGSSPSSPTVGMRTENTMAAAVRITIAIKGAGTSVVILGRNTMITKPTATKGYTSAGTPSRCGNCEVKIRIAKALTNPTITLRGTKRINRATPRTLSRIWKTPARRTAATK